MEGMKESCIQVTIGEIGFVGGSLYNGFICLFIYFPTKKVVFLGYQFLRILKFVR